MCHRLAKFEHYRVIRTRWNFELFDKKASTIFDKASTPFWNMFMYLKQMFDAKVLIKRLPSFSVPKIILIWHVKPILKLQWTWQTQTVLWKNACTLKAVIPLILAGRTYYFQTTMEFDQYVVSNYISNFPALNRSLTQTDSVIESLHFNSI